MKKISFLCLVFCVSFVAHGWWSKGAYQIGGIDRGAYQDTVSLDCTPPTITAAATRIDTAGVKDTFNLTLGGGTCDSVTGVSLPAWMSLDKTGANMGRVIVNPTDSVNKTGYQFIAHGCAKDTCFDTITVTWGDVKLSSFTPDTVEAGDTAIIIGRGFKSSQGTSTFAWGDSTPTIVKWVNDTIKAICPDMDSGFYTFTACNGTMCDTMADSIYVRYIPDTIPLIDSIRPIHGIVGTIDTIFGRHFGPSPKLYINSLANIVPTISADSVRILFSALVGYQGTVNFIVENQTYMTRDTIAWSYDTIPALSSAWPPYAKLTPAAPYNHGKITGTGMANIDSVWYGTQLATIDSATYDTLYTTIPAQTVRGSVAIRTRATYGYRDTLADGITYKNLHITALTPSSGKIGDTVSLHAVYGLGTTGLSVKFNDTSAAVLAGYVDTLARVIAPNNVSGNFPVETVNGANDTTFNFWRYGGGSKKRPAFGFWWSGFRF
jgi:hypothetical protein